MVVGARRGARRREQDRLAVEPPAEQLGDPAAGIGELGADGVEELQADRIGLGGNRAVCSAGTGLGIGGLLTAITAVAAEHSSTRRRHLSVSIMSIGYPVGAVVGGVIAARLLADHDWRAVFYFGSAATALFVPIVFWLVPESVPWLVRRVGTGGVRMVKDCQRRFPVAAS